MEKIKFYPLGLNVINCAPNMILVNGFCCANSFKDFVKWFKLNNLHVEQFKNWPFEFGIYSTIK